MDKTELIAAMSKSDFILKIIILQGFLRFLLIMRPTVGRLEQVVKPGSGLQVLVQSFLIMIIVKYVVILENIQL